MEYTMKLLRTKDSFEYQNILSLSKKTSLAAKSKLLNFSIL
jgi:hypothetical protein